MIKGLLGLALSALLSFTGFEAWDYYVRVDHPEALLKTEDALAMDGLV